MMQRGEVRWYTFARPDKRRPVVILTRNTVLAYLGEVTVAPLTSVIRDIPSEVFLAPLDGMPRDCVINLDHIQTVAHGKVGALITTLSPATMAQLRQALLFAPRF